MSENGSESQILSYNSTLNEIVTERWNAKLIESATGAARKANDGKILADVTQTAVRKLNSTVLTVQ